MYAYTHSLLAATLPTTITMNEYNRQLDCDKSMLAQDMFAADIESYWDCKLHQDHRVKDGRTKTDIYMPIDYIITKKDSKKVKGYIELKCRNIVSYKYNSLILDLTKVMHMKQYHELTKLPIFVGVRFNDKDLYWKFEPDLDLDIHFTGRTKQKRCEYDVTQCVYIPFINFKRFERIKYDK